MHFRHFHDHEAFGRGPFSGRHGGRGGRFGGGFGGREARMFDSGELKLVILAMIAEKPRHGYELIKELGERVGGDYSPSPGVVYPTLTLLEDMGYATSSTDSAQRKLYTATPEGEKILADNKAQIDAILARFGGAKDDDETSPGMGSLFRAMMNLRAAVRLRARSVKPEQLQQIIDALDAAAKTIERL
jgi:DNA-binding PadR family transcriptional regulator